ncbi:hypothetical protein EJD97_004778 [Solanum chilense]|uniref:CCHC-type domain-containing protein n=1 Tax=Solanum chilense TaxID=4083 RepID=A0A6N2CHU1_SOLCI|nr:hypothetical protein EJD97_004778 [Solanum chilense]
MKTRRKVGGEIGGAATVVIQVSPQAPAAGIEMLVNLAGLTDGEERPPCKKCGILHGGEGMMDSNACYSCGKPGYMIKDCPNRRIQEQGKERVQPNGPSEEGPRRQRFFALNSRGAGEGTSSEVSGS